MGNSQSFRDLENVEDVLEERRQEHGGDTWEVFSKLFETAYTHVDFEPLFDSAYFTMWVMILFKLARAASNPFNKDNWLDIQGYAQLVLREIAHEAERDVPSE